MAAEKPDLNVYVREDLYETKPHGNPAYPIAIYRVDSLEMNLELVHWHWHEELEIILVESGTARFYFDDSCYVLSGGDCILVNQNTMHRVKPYEDHDCVYYSVVFHPSIIFRPEDTLIREKYFDPVIAQTSFKYYILDPTRARVPHFISIVNKLIEVNETQNFGYELMTKSYLLDLWLIILSGLHKKTLTPRISVNQNANDDERIKDALTYIANHYADPITLQDIADAIHVSKSECCRCFKRKLRITPFEYLIKYRVYSATHLIVCNINELSISEIAMKTGFNSSSYFNKMFRKYIGCTPSEFRKTADINLSNTRELLHKHIHSHDVVFLEELLKKTQNKEL